MPKSNTKFTAKFTVKLGKTPLEIKVPVDASEADPAISFETYATELGTRAQEVFGDLVAHAVTKFKNQADAKRAFKAHVKAQVAVAKKPAIAATNGCVATDPYVPHAGE